MGNYPYSLIIIKYGGKCSKILKIKKERTPLIYFLSSPLKQREVTNFAKGDNLIASLGKIGYFPNIILLFFFSKLKFYCTNFFEYLPYLPYLFFCPKLTSSAPLHFHIIPYTEPILDLQ